MPATKTNGKVNGISPDAVKAKTGKPWEEWIALLDAAGGRQMDHKQIVAHLAAKHDVGPWWRQMVAVGYEQAAGLRTKHEVVGGFQVSRSKTLNVPLPVLFAAWSDKRKRARWLADPGFTVRKATTDKSMRITWVDGETHVEAMFFGKGDGKSQVSVQHNKLATAKDAERVKAYWGEQLDKLQAYLHP